MNYVKMIYLLLVVALISLTAAHDKENHDNHDHGHSHVHLSQKHKHGVHKFTYDIKHGKHGHAHGSAYPNGYGGFGH